MDRKIRRTKPSNIASQTRIRPGRGRMRQHVSRTGVLCREDTGGRSTLCIHHATYRGAVTSGAVGGWLSLQGARTACCRLIVTNDRTTRTTPWGLDRKTCEKPYGYTRPPPIVYSQTALEVWGIGQSCSQVSASLSIQATRCRAPTLARKRGGDSGMLNPADVWVGRWFVENPSLNYSTDVLMQDAPAARLPNHACG
jgi:hypothetical protein